MFDEEKRTRVWCWGLNLNLRFQKFLRRDKYEGRARGSKRKGETRERKRVSTPFDTDLAQRTPHARSPWRRRGGAVPGGDSWRVYVEDSLNLVRSWHSPRALWILKSWHMEARSERKEHRLTILLPVPRAIHPFVLLFGKFRTAATHQRLLRHNTTILESTLCHRRRSLEYSSAFFLSSLLQLFCVTFTPRTYLIIIIIFAFYKEIVKRDIYNILTLATNFRIASLVPSCNIFFCVKLL